MSLSDAYEIYKISGSVFSQVLNDNDIVCSDDDEDGYYFWGVGPKPSNCPSWIPNEPDGDDSDSCLGPIDEYGICDTLTINPAITWNIDSLLSR